MPGPSHCANHRQRANPAATFRHAALKAMVDKVTTPRHLGQPAPSGMVNRVQPVAPQQAIAPKEMAAEIRATAHVLQVPVSGVGLLATCNIAAF